MGQAKRSKVLAYLRARERLGIEGTGPFDLAEALARLDVQLSSGLPVWKAIAEELAGTGQVWDCGYCHGAKARVDVASVYEMFGEDGRCIWCRGTGHNIHASLPWPAWLRRKGTTVTQLRTVHKPIGSGVMERSSNGWPPNTERILVTLLRATWVSHDFSAACTNVVEYTDERRQPVPVVEMRVERRTREYPRGQHRGHDPWRTAEGLGARAWVRCPHDRMPAWLRGDLDHADRRRERERARRHREAGIQDGRVEWSVDDANAITGIRLITEYTGPSSPTITLGDADEAIETAVRMRAEADDANARRNIPQTTSATWVLVSPVDLQRIGVRLQAGEHIEQRRDPGSHATRWRAISVAPDGQRYHCHEVTITERELVAAISPAERVRDRLLAALHGVRAEQAHAGEPVVGPITWMHPSDAGVGGLDPLLESIGLQPGEALESGRDPTNGTVRFRVAGQWGGTLCEVHLPERELVASRLGMLGQAVERLRDAVADGRGRRAYTLHMERTRTTMVLARGVGADWFAHTGRDYTRWDDLDELTRVEWRQRAESQAHRSPFIRS